MRSSVFLFGSIMAALSLAVLTPRTASAGDQEYPVSFVERPLTLPRFTLAPQVEFDINRLAGPGATTGIPVVAGIQIGASFGITKDLEVGAVVLPIQFNNGAGYGGTFVGEEAPGEPQVFGTFRFLHMEEKLDLGVRLRLVVAPPANGIGAGVLIEPSVPLIAYLSKRVRLDAEVGIPIGLSATTKTGTGAATVTTGGATIGIDVPVSVAFDIIEPLHVGVSTGLRIESFGTTSETAIPLGIFAGYAIGEKRPIVDIDPFFSFYRFATPAAEDGESKINGGQFIVGVSARGYLYF